MSTILAPGNWARGCEEGNHPHLIVTNQRQPISSPETPHQDISKDQSVRSISPNVLQPTQLKMVILGASGLIRRYPLTANTSPIFGFYGYRPMEVSVVIAVFAAYGALGLAGPVTVSRGAAWLTGGAPAMDI